MKSPHTIDAFSKAQRIRMIDVLILGPLMIYVGTRARPLENWEKLSMAFFGATTIGYNWYYFQKNKKLGYN
jgi:hypothetical protein